MEKIKELRMTLIIILVGVFFISGCFFNDKHTITFKTNGGSEVKNVSVKSGSKLDDVETPTKDGYIFDGWYLDGEEFDFDKKIDEDITLVAKWIKESYDENNTGDKSIQETSEQPTTVATTSTSTTKVTKTTKEGSLSTHSKTTLTKTTKKTTTSTSTTSKTTTTTTQKVEVTTTKVVEVNNPLEPGVVDVPTIEPTPIVPTTKPIDIKIELLYEETKEETDDEEKKDEVASGIEYLKITRTLDDVNVTSTISEGDLNSLLESDMNTWQIISNHAYFYEYIVEDSVVLLKGDKDVTSFTVVYDGSSYIFEYDEELKEWTIKYPTVSVGVGLNVIYYNNIETTIKVAGENDTIKLLADQEVENGLKLTNPIKIDGSNYKITNKDGYLINLEDILYDEESELVIYDLIIDVDSFIYIGKSKFENIKLDNITGNIKEHKIDKEIGCLFENTSLLQQLQ